MKKNAAIILIVAILISSCVVENNSLRGSGTFVTENRSVKGITSVNLTTFVDLEITLGEEENLEIEAEDNLLPYIETEVTRGTLTIKTPSDMNFLTTRQSLIRLTVKELDSLSASSSGSITASAMESERFLIDVYSSGDIHLAGVKADTLKVEISSSGNVIIDEGVVTDQDITISSSGEYFAENVKSQTATINLSSSGEATVWVQESLDARLSSSGDVNYYGEPRIRENHSSSGSVKSLGNK